jgi:hypothetical protein
MFVSISIYVCNHYFALIPFASSLRTCTSLLLSRSDFDIFLSNNSLSVDPAGAFSKYLRCQMKDGRKFYLLDLCLSDLRESRYQTPKNIDFFSRLAIGSKIFGSLGVPNGHNGCIIHLFILYNFSFPGHNLIFKLFQRLIFVVDKTFLMLLLLSLLLNEIGISCPLCGALTLLSLEQHHYCCQFS